MKNNSKWNIQNIIVSICFFAVVLATQQIQTKAWNSGLIELSRDATGVLLAIVIMTNYKWNDFVRHRIIYGVWTVLGGIALAVGLPIAIEHRYEFLLADTIVIAVGIFLMGYCIIHTVISFFVMQYRPRVYKPLFVLWFVLMFWMILSESEYLWPECYFVLFLCYYFTEQTPEQRRNTYVGMVNGIVLGFLAIQGHSLLCRPYDRLKYFGNFCNPNHNCMFLCMCLVAILAKILVGIRDGHNKWMQTLRFLMAAVCYSFIFMTVCRSGYLATFVVTVFFLWGYCKIIAKKVFFRMGLVLVSLFVVVMPLTYMAVRYIPTIHPYVVFYFQEGYSKTRVHSWDPRDSEKYISFEEMLKHVMERFGTFFESVENFDNVSRIEKYNELKIVSSVDYIPNVSFAIVNPEFVKHMDPDKIPALELEGGSRSNQILVRYTIYKWYYDHLTLRGMPYDEQGFQLTQDHWIQDTHNIYLDYGINFGWPAMIMFAVFIWWGIGRLTVRGMKMRDVETLTCLLICLVPPIFGLFEYSWGPGMISTVAFYLAFKEMFSMEPAQCSIGAQAPAMVTVASSVESVSEEPVDDLEFLDI